jgi:hypothetical protein
MTVTRLHVVNAGKPELSKPDLILTALNQAVEDQKLDEALKQSARGIAIVWFREYPDGSFGESWIIEGMNEFEAIGLMHMAAKDIIDGGLTAGPDHFPGARPKPEEPA